MLTFLLLALQNVASPPPAAPALVAGQGQPATVTTASGVEVETLEAGSGRRPTLADAVLVSYEGRLADGTVFDRTDAPVGLGVADVVDGFTEALLVMNEGGRYRFRIPPQAAYGRRGVPGVVPPDAELTFTLHLIRVGRPARR
ncbi:MAG: FKBP-type peptidyl-prolyl cis-trans isomerase [Allosphingosinicella sp.]